MKPRIALISIFTQNLEAMVAFYQDVLGFEVAFQQGKYVEFKNEGVRFSICDLEVMQDTVDHPVFRQPRSGQPFELAFDALTPPEVDRLYTELIAGGAKPIQPPTNMPWNQRTAFFADLDGNVHEIFADLPQD